MSAVARYQSAPGEQVHIYKRSGDLLGRGTGKMGDGVDATAIGRTLGRTTPAADVLVRSERRLRALHRR
jgi:hypothetical protein